MNLLLSFIFLRTNLILELKFHRPKRFKPDFLVLVPTKNPFKFGSKRLYRLLHKIASDPNGKGVTWKSFERRVRCLCEHFGERRGAVSGSSFPFERPKMNLIRP